jgi:oligoribonuclease NrnB/cAMP/cGMP phosphodiesterase (DHH superfamily)
MIVFHHNDADGRSSAAITKRWFDKHWPIESPFKLQDTNGRVVFVEVDYARAVPIESILANEMVAIVDFSFRPEDMVRIQSATKVGVIWCDHHKTAERYGYDVPGVRDFTNKGMAGCECTWKFFFPNQDKPDWIRILGDYDAWRMCERDKCLPFYEGLKMENQTPGTDGNIWDRLLDDQTDATVEAITLQGACAMKYRDNYCKELREAFGYATVIGGHQAYAMNAYRFGSLAFGSKMLEFPVCIAYIHDGRKYTVSLYSETVDVSVIAKSFGGGGHKGAAGFVCDVLPWHVS